MSELLTMQAEISLVAIILFMLLADLILKTPNHKPLQTLACTLMVVQLALNIVPASGEAFGGMYHASQMASVVKTILTAGTLLVFLQSGEWLSREDTRHKTGEFYMLTLSTLLGMYFMVSAGSFILFYVGLELARGSTLDDILRTLGHVAEGVSTAREVVRLAQRSAAEMPICEAVDALLHQGLDARAAVERLLARDPRHE